MDGRLVAAIEFLEVCGFSFTGEADGKVTIEYPPEQTPENIASQFAGLVSCGEMAEFLRNRDQWNVRRSHAQMKSSRSRKPLLRLSEPNPQP